MKFVDPKNDVAFKKIFGNEQHKEILIAFLNAVLDLTDEREIADIDILNPYQTPRIQELKYTLLDVLARDRRGVNFIIEMQVEHVSGFEKRFLYYAAKTYVSQIERAEEYPRLNQVIFIGILDFVAFDGPDYQTRHLLMNQRTYQQSMTDLEFNFIELPKFTKSEAELTATLDKWIYFLKHASDLDVIPDNVDTAPLRAAYEVANQFGWSREEIELYDYWGMKEQDVRGAIQFAVDEATRTIARSMLQQGLTPEQVASMTGLTPDEVAALQA
jgi:predicted transposase/invertase (TIGR01784 family)